jgi:hypothetical protein
LAEDLLNLQLPGGVRFVYRRIRVETAAGNSRSPPSRTVIPNPAKEYLSPPADGVILREAHPRSCRDAPGPVRRPKNLPAGRTIVSATTGPGARKARAFPKEILRSAHGLSLVSESSWRRLPQDDTDRQSPLFLRIRYCPESWSQQAQTAKGGARALVVVGRHQRLGHTGQAGALE